MTKPAWSLEHFREQVRDHDPVIDWQQAMRQAVYDGVNAEDVKQIVDGIVARAKAGDKQAIDQLFKYVIAGPRSLTFTQENHFHGGGGEGHDHDGPNATNGRCLPKAGTKDKLAVMRERAANGEPLCQPGDHEEDLN